jgi:hypothetical protein
VVNQNGKDNAIAVKTDSTSLQMPTDSIASEGQGNADSTYAYIKETIKRNDSVFIQADYIQFLTGDLAVAAAKKNHEADTSYDDKGKITSVFVDNDYYILNENKKLRLLPLAKNVEIETVDMSAGVSIAKTTLDNFISKHGNDSFPFILHIRNNIVIKITEVYVP